MQDDSRKRAESQAAGPLGPDSIEVGVRHQIREWLEALVEAELTAVLGKAASARGPERVGDRHGHARNLSTSLGPTTFDLPRARVRGDAGATTECTVRWCHGISAGPREWMKRCAACI